MATVDAIPANKQGACSSCGKVMWKSATSAAVQRCRPCRASAPPVHGTAAGYRRGCRCDTCRRDASDKQREYLRKRKQTLHIQCTVTDCSKDRKAHGLCGMHLRRKQKADGTWVPSPSDAWDAPARLAKYKARKAMTRGNLTTAERFSVSDLIERDGPACGICHTPILDREWPDPLSPSIDHIVPLSRGGSHTLLNARATHLGCNIRRGARD